MLTAHSVQAERYTKVMVGSGNPAKVDAVREVFADYDHFTSAEFISVSVDSGVRDQPLSLDEIIRGAKNRAVHAYQKGSLSVGLEGGITPLPGSDEYIHINICSLYDGEKHHIGMSSGFRIPKQLVRLILEEGLDLSQAMQKAQLTGDPEIGMKEGAIGLFTKGRITRKEYCKQSLTTALISIENPAF